MQPKINTKIKKKMQINESLGNRGKQKDVEKEYFGNIERIVES